MSSTPPMYSFQALELEDAEYVPGRELPPPPPLTLPPSKRSFALGPTQPKAPVPELPPSLLSASIKPSVPSFSEELAQEAVKRGEELVHYAQGWDKLSEQLAQQQRARQSVQIAQEAVKRGEELVHYAQGWDKLSEQLAQQQLARQSRCSSNHGTSRRPSKSETRRSTTTRSTLSDFRSRSTLSDLGTLPNTRGTLNDVAAGGRLLSQVASQPFLDGSVKSLVPAQVPLATAFGWRGLAPKSNTIISSPRSCSVIPQPTYVNQQAPPVHSMVRSESVPRGALMAYFNNPKTATPHVLHVPPHIPPRSRSGSPAIPQLLPPPPPPASHGGARSRSASPATMSYRPMMVLGSCSRSGSPAMCRSAVTAPWAPLQSSSSSGGSYTAPPGHPAASATCIPMQMSGSYTAPPGPAAVPVALCNGMMSMRPPSPTQYPSMPHYNRIDIPPPSPVSNGVALRPPSPPLRHQGSGVGTPPRLPLQQQMTSPASFVAPAASLMDSRRAFATQSARTHPKGMPLHSHRYRGRSHSQTGANHLGQAGWVKQLGADISDHRACSSTDMANGPKKRSSSSSTIAPNTIMPKGVRASPSSRYSVQNGKPLFVQNGDGSRNDTGCTTSPQSSSREITGFSNPVVDSQRGFTNGYHQSNLPQTYYDFSYGTNLLRSSEVHSPHPVHGKKESKSLDFGPSDYQYIKVAADDPRVVTPETLHRWKTETPEAWPIDVSASGGAWSSKLSSWSPSSSEQPISLPGPPLDPTAAAPCPMPASQNQSLPGLRIRTPENPQGRDMAELPWSLPSPIHVQQRNNHRGSDTSSSKVYVSVEKVEMQNGSQVDVGHVGKPQELSVICSSKMPVPVEVQNGLPCDDGTQEQIGDISPSVMQKAGTSIVPHKGLNGKASVRCKTVHTLARIAEKSEKGDRGIIAAVVERLDDDDTEVQCVTLDALARISERGDQEVIKAVSSCIEGNDPRVQRTALITLAEIADKDDPNVLALMTKQLENSDQSVQEVAVDLLERMAEDNAHRYGSKIVTAMASEAEDNAVTTLAKIAQGGEKGVISAVSEQLENKDPECRQAALNVLKRIGERNNRDTLNAVVLMLDDTNATVRCTAVEALAHLAEKGDQQIISVVANHVEDADKNVRHAVVVALAHLAEVGDYGAVSVLLPLLQDREASVRRAAVESLRAMQERNCSNTEFPEDS